MPTPDELAADRRLAAAVGRSLVEVLQGRRPLAVLAAWADEPALDAVAAAAVRRDWRRTRLAGVRACRPADETLECSLHLADGRAHLAAAIRLEMRHGRWMIARCGVILPAAVADAA